MSRILKASNKNGASMLRRASIDEGYSLSDVYDTYSPAKGASWEWCFRKYADTPDSTNFHICSHNTFAYCVSWNGTYNGERAVFVETPNNSYIVLLDR